MSFAMASSSVELKLVVPGRRRSAEDFGGVHSSVRSEYEDQGVGSVGRRRPQHVQRDPMAPTKRSASRAVLRGQFF